MDLRDKNILFICPVFYDYHKKIKTELELAGAVVLFVENKFFPQDPVCAQGISDHVQRFIKPNYKKNYTDEILSQIEGRQFNYLFCIGGFSISETLLRGIKSNNPDIVSILYLWDSFSVWNYSHLIDLFDIKYSFDRKDSEQYPTLNYQPLFYTSEYTNKLAEKDIDLLYVGSVGIPSQDRLSALGKISDYCKVNNLVCFLWLYYPEIKNSWLKSKLKLLRKIYSSKYRKFENELIKYKSNYNFIKHQTLTREEVAKLMQRARCIIDIAVPGQFGLTIRTVETLAAGKKILTNNSYIAKEPFYNSALIGVSTFETIDVESAFITTQSRAKIDVSKLHLKNWISNIFSLGHGIV